MRRKVHPAATLASTGVYSFDGATGAPTFHFIDPPTKQELTDLVHELSGRVTRMLKRRGLIRDGPVQAAADENGQAALDACRGVSLRRARFERVDDKGQSQQQLFADQPAGSNRKASSPAAADFAGFSPEAGVAMSALNKESGCARHRGPPLWLCFEARRGLET